MNSKNVTKSQGEVIIQFNGVDKHKEVTINFTSMNQMFTLFHKEWKKAQEERLYIYHILRYCVDNSVYRDAFATNWFLQERHVSDQREGSVINRSNIFGIKILFDQYIFEKEGK